MLKNQKGITLVALVVTIVVLIILATISIQLAVNSGIIGQAQKAKTMYEGTSTKFNELEANITEYINHIIANPMATE